MVAVLSTDAIPQLRLTVDEYLLADLPEGFDYELVNGVVAMTPKPQTPHDDVLGILNETLIRYKLVHASAFAHLSMSAEVAIPEFETVRQPDLALFREWPTTDDYDPRKWKELTPFLVCEVVSPGQADRDYKEKREEYRLAGVEEYWIVDRQAKRFTVLRRGDDDWIEIVFPPPGNYEPELLSGMTLDLRPLLRLPD